MHIKQMKQYEYPINKKKHMYREREIERKRALNIYVNTLNKGSINTQYTYKYTYKNITNTHRYRAWATLQFLAFPWHPSSRQYTNVDWSRPSRNSQTSARSSIVYRKLLESWLFKISQINYTCTDRSAGWAQPGRNFEKSTRSSFFYRKLLESWILRISQFIYRQERRLGIVEILKNQLATHFSTDNYKGAELWEFLKSFTYVHIRAGWARPSRHSQKSAL